MGHYFFDPPGVDLTITVDFSLLLSLQPPLSLTIELHSISVFCFFLKVTLALLSFLFSDDDVSLLLHKMFRILLIVLATTIFLNLFDLNLF